MLDRRGGVWYNIYAIISGTHLTVLKISIFGGRVETQLFLKYRL